MLLVAALVMGIALGGIAAAMTGIYGLSSVAGGIAGFMVGFVITLIVGLTNHDLPTPGSL